MSAAEERVERQFIVAEGGAEDECPLCHIWRENAGYIRETCGEGFGRDGCFVVTETAAGDNG